MQTSIESPEVMNVDTTIEAAILALPIDHDNPLVLFRKIVGQTHMLDTGPSTEYMWVAGRVDTPQITNDKLDTPYYIGTVDRTGRGYLIEPETERPASFFFSTGAIMLGIEPLNLRSAQGETYLHEEVDRDHEMDGIQDIGYKKEQRAQLSIIGGNAAARKIDSLFGESVADLLAQPDMPLGRVASKFLF